ncbi:MAG: FapA family protein [Nitrospirota bacterium]|nr:FapA family protein [Nitrospirota bacterium]
MQLTIRFDDQDRTLYGDLSPSEEPEAISSLSIKGKLEEAGYTNLTVDPKVIADLLAKALQGQECTIALKTLADATVSVTIASDKCQASLTLTAADGGQPLTMDMITQAIVKAGVSDLQVDQEMLKRCYERQSVKDMCIAQARLPIQGKSAVYIPLVESETIASPDVDEHGVADVMNTHQFVLVDIGTPLMRRVPATEGEAGLDVTGKEMKPVPGNDPGFTTNLTGAVISSEDPNMLLAAIKGHPVVGKNGVTVDSTFHVDNVDVTTGNITFDGSLEVKGEVVAGMTINVTGDVFIKGGVERAAIKAGQSIKVGGGIFGGEEAERSEGEIIEYQITAGSDIEAKFVHLSTLAAENNIVVKDYISHSYVKSGNQLLVGQETGKGLVFGGQCEALHRAVMNQFGNEAYIPTHVTAGKLNELYQAYHNIEKELTTRSQEVAQLETILEKTQKSDPVVLGKMPVDKSEKIRNTIVAINEKMAGTQDLLHALEPEIELQKKAAIEVTKTIYPNAGMTINGTTKRFSEQTTGDTWVQWGDTLLEQEKVEQEKKAGQAKQAEQTNVEPEKKD